MVSPMFVKIILLLNGVKFIIIIKKKKKSRMSIILGSGFCSLYYSMEKKKKKGPKVVSFPATIGSKPAIKKKPAINNQKRSENQNLPLTYDSKNSDNGISKMHTMRHKRDRHQSSLIAKAIMCSDAIRTMRP